MYSWTFNIIQGSIWYAIVPTTEPLGSLLLVRGLVWLLWYMDSRTQGASRNTGQLNSYLKGEAGYITYLNWECSNMEKNFRIQFWYHFYGVQFLIKSFKPFVIFHQFSNSTPYYFIPSHFPLNLSIKHCLRTFLNCQNIFK